MSDPYATFVSFDHVGVKKSIYTVYACSMSAQCIDVYSVYKPHSCLYVPETYSVMYKKECYKQ
jgi:hypothetical protein